MTCDGFRLSSILRENTNPMEIDTNTFGRAVGFQYYGFAMKKKCFTTPECHESNLPRSGNFLEFGALYC